MAKKGKVNVSAETAAMFTSVYGKDDTKLEAWQRLCRDVGASEGDSIRERKKNIKGKFINIVDFVRRDFTVFPTAKALRIYMFATPGKIFWLDAAKNNPLRKAMLIKLY